VLPAPATTGNGVCVEPLTAGERQAALGHRGATLWLTGLPAAGKSTLSVAIERAIVARGLPAYRLDGDELRSQLSGDLGFSREDRGESVRRAATIARWIADAGNIAIVALVSPYRDDRSAARRLHDAYGLPFVEIHVATPLAECERRDPKGLFARARRGEVKGLTGIDDPYEPPDRPELVVRGMALERDVHDALTALRRRAIVP
jgi:bifunctional enzyme CysN/CysC